MKYKGIKKQKSLVSGGLSKTKHTFGTHPNSLFFYITNQIVKFY